MTLPDFVVIGAAKAGTTSLCADLARHPNVYFSQPKEPEFFCRDEKYGLGHEWYENLFAEARPGQIVGEGSTMYTNCVRFPNAMERMHSLIPDAKLIYMVRHPVERAYSYWLQIMKNQANFGGDMEVPRDFDRAVESHEPIISIGDYKLQLDHVLRFYSRSRVHVVVFEEYTRDRLKTLDRLCPFLGIEPGPIAEAMPVWENRSAAHFSNRAKTDLANRLKRLRFVREGRKSVPKPLRALVLGLAAKLVERKYQPAPMTDKTRRQLEDRYSHVRPWLESYLGYSLSSWDKSA